MFEDFNDKGPDEGRGRRGVSALLSLGIFGALALVVGGAITAHQVRRQRAEREQQVAFADLPAVKAPKPKALTKPAAAAKRAAAKRQRVVDLKEIPVERPDEAEGDLATAEDTGAVDGLIEKKATASPPPPPPAVAAAPKSDPVLPLGEQERESIEAPRFISGCRAPEVPNALLSNAATIRIEVEMMIDASGRVTTARVLQSHQLVPDDLVLICARAQVFEPAHLPDGTAVPYPYRRRFVFKPSQA
ncbi:MAG: energy transducer TonB [Bacteroidota bacterium]